MKNKIRIPKHLSNDAKKLFKYVTESFELEQHHLHLLCLACEALTRAKQARKEIEKYGLTSVDRYGQVKMRPEVQIERDSRISFCRLIRELNLSEEPEESRPPRLKYGG